MQLWRYIITANLILLCFSASAQTVNLSRMQRALGKDRIIFTDSSGQQQYRLLKNILDTMITAGNVGSGTTGTIAMWSADTLRNSRITQQDSTISITPVAGDFAFTFRYRAFGIPSSFYPELRSQWLGFYGDDDVGIKYTGTNNFELYAGSGSTGRYAMRALGSTLSFDGNRDGVVDLIIGSTTDISRSQFTSLSSNNTTHILGLTATDLGTKLAIGRGLSISSGSSVDTLQSRPGTGTTHIVPRWSGDTLTNSGIISNGTVVAFDPGLNGTYDVSISETTMNVESVSASLQVTAGASLVVNGFSINDAEALGGWTSGNTASKVVIGSGFSFGRGAVVDTLKYSGSATTIDTFTFTNDTLRLSLAGDGEPAKIVSLLPSYAQISSYSSESITATSITKYAPVSGWIDLESGDLDAQGASNQINPNAAMKARITLSASAYMDGGSFAGYVNFYIYKNGSLLTPAVYSLGKFDTDEYKVVNINILADLAANDEIDFRYSLSTSLSTGTMYMYNPILTVEKL